MNSQHIYTNNGELIEPGQYKLELAGAVVVMSFRIKYVQIWNRSLKHNDKLQCMTEIIQVRVIKKMASASARSSAVKRRAPANPLFGPSSKKRAL